LPLPRSNGGGRRVFEAGWGFGPRGRGVCAAVMAVLTRVFGLRTRVNGPVTRVSDPFTHVMGAITRVDGLFTRVNRANTRVIRANTRANRARTLEYEPETGDDGACGAGNAVWAAVDAGGVLAQPLPAFPSPAPRGGGGWSPRQSEGVPRKAGCFDEPPNAPPKTPSDLGDSATSPGRPGEGKSCSLTALGDSGTSLGAPT
jgi:hypothetical protein